MCVHTTVHKVYCTTKSFFLRERTSHSIVWFCGYCHQKFAVNYDEQIAFQAIFDSHSQNLNIEKLLHL